MPTMVDVARLAGVSVKTVSNVINDYPHIRDTTRDRVLKAIAELGYEVNAAARSLRSGRTGIIGLAVPELGQPYFGELADEVLAAARAKDLRVIIEPTGFTRDGELAALRVPRRGLIDGLLFSPAEITAEDVDLLHFDIPIVLLGEQLFSRAVDHVTMHNVVGARSATDLLLDHGRRRIAVLGAPGNHPGGAATLRFEGYRQALEARGVELDTRLLGSAGDGWHRENGAKAMATVLDSGVEPDGVVAFNDALAMGAMYELQVRGLRIPDDVAVIGFDDTEDARYTIPPLTTVDAGRREIARVAVDVLCQRMQDAWPAPDPVLHLATMRIIERGSTPPRSD